MHTFEHAMGKLAMENIERFHEVLQVSCPHPVWGTLKQLSHKAQDFLGLPGWCRTDIPSLYSQAAKPSSTPKSLKYSSWEQTVATKAGPTGQVYVS